MEVVRVDNEDLLKRFEDVRLSAFHLENNNSYNSYYYNIINNKKSVGYTLLNDNNVIGGIIVSRGITYGILEIESLFIRDEYQGMGLGSSLLTYVLVNKKGELEEYYNTTFNKCYAEPSKDKEEFYYKQGYSDSSMGYVSKRI